jgi:hypothetical protein
LVNKSNGSKRSTVTTGLLCKIGKTGTREGGIAMDILSKKGKGEQIGLNDGRVGYKGV